MASLIHISRAQTGCGVCCIMEDILALTASAFASSERLKNVFFTVPRLEAPCCETQKCSLAAVKESLERI